MGTIFEDAVNEALKEYEIGKLSDSDANNAIEAMSANMDTQDNPKVGIFWYDIKSKSLFGVIAIDKDSFEKPNVGGGLISCRELHKNVWKKEFNIQRFKRNGVGLFNGDYKDTPRGRVFYNPNNDEYIIAVGSWINNHQECIDEILYRYDLTNQKYKIEISEHWEIGNGWEG